LVAVAGKWHRIARSGTTGLIHCSLHNILDTEEERYDRKRAIFRNSICEAFS
jgi:hypothetical protein